MSSLKTQGWILDLYHKDGRMVIWIKSRDGTINRLVDNWSPAFYVAGRQTDLMELARQINIEGLTLEEKYVSIDDYERSQVLRVPAETTSRALEISKLISLSARKYKLFNVDIPAEQTYLYEKDLFPLAYIEAESDHGTIKWRSLDYSGRVDYETPPLEPIDLTATTDSEWSILNFNDPLKEIRITSQGEETTLSFNEERNILELVRLLKEIDPDVVYTQNGNSFLFPYLAARAWRLGIPDQLILGRERIPLKTQSRGGRVYTSYGMVYYRPAPARLHGRIHIDREQAFLYNDCGLEGILEVSRACRIPVQRCIDSTIGTSMTSIQLYHAFKRDILAPWFKALPEELKTVEELVLADRGGLYYSPISGVYDNVGELDFSSLYPALMCKFNLSGETVKCRCCPQSRNRVPELGYNICEKRRGITPISLEEILEKRLRYKQMIEETSSPALRDTYEKRQAALKWILVTAFGYLGFKNARFGKIDAHIATCAFSRETLQKTVRIAEMMGFSLVHAIVDSVWVTKKGAEEADYLELAGRIRSELGLPISFEGIYRWIIFLPSKVRPELPAHNRYYGVFTDGRIKCRGIELRRRDAPVFIKRLQHDIISRLAEAHNSEELFRSAPTTIPIIKDYIKVLRAREVDPLHLLVQKHLSKTSSEYKKNYLHSIAAKQLSRGGMALNQGESVTFLITDEDNPIPERRVLAREFVNEDSSYDTARYEAMLLESASNILSPLGYSIKHLQRALESTDTPLHT
ncbi:hypothetical protein KEJ39_09310 [Candidatus Bathyarchaeota archaeon]|nr:hypothetical protein [Candidatus Bathyarchaeota archaeon]